MSDLSVVNNFNEEDINEVNRSSQIEPCKNDSDVLLSETVERILTIIVGKLNRWKSETEKMKNNEILDLFDLYVSWEPITKMMRDKLMSFFMSSEAINLWNEILSRIHIVQSDQNKPFIRRFLEDSNWKYTSINFVNYVLDELENYPLILEIDLAEWEMIERLTSYVYWVWSLYLYRDSLGAYKLVSINDVDNWFNVIYLEEKFIDKPKFLINWLVFWVQERLVSANWLEQEIDDPSSIPKISDFGFLYQFDWTKLIKVYEKEWIVWMNSLDEEAWLWEIVNLEWKKWVIKQNQWEQEEWEFLTTISELIDANNDAVYYLWDWLIVSEEGFVDKNVKYKNVFVHVIQPSSNECSIILRAIDEWRQNCQLWLPSVRYFEDLWIIRVTTTDLDYYYTIKKQTKTLSHIQWLQWIHIIWDEEKFLRRDYIVRIYVNWINFVMIYDKDSKSPRHILQSRDGLSIKWERITIWENHYLWYHNWNFYKLDEKKYYILDLHQLVCKKWLINRLPWKDNKVAILGTTYESIMPYLVQVHFDWPILVI